MIMKEEIDSFAVFTQKNLCVQEEESYCTNVCPLKVDVKYMMKKTAEGDFDAAYKNYQKSVLFPEIISRLCHQPCKDACFRTKIDEPMEIKKIERAISVWAESSPAQTYASRRRQETIAVIGGSLRGLTAAIILSRKGYQVTLFEKSSCLGGWVLEFLPAELVEKDLKLALSDLSIDIRLNQEIKSIESLEYNMVYMAFSETDKNSEIYRPATDIAIGKRAARSMEMQLKGSLEPCINSEEIKDEMTTKLFTPIPENEHENAAVRPKDPKKGYSREEAQREAGRCIQCECRACVKGCDFMQHYQRYPKAYINDAQQSLRTLKLIQAKLAARQTNSCNLCGQCGQICPTGVDMSEVYMHSRRIMRENKNLPEAFHDFWLRDMEFAESEQAFLMRRQPEKNDCQYLLFPGCQMGGSNPDYVTETYQYLCEKLVGSVGLYLGCCGAPSEWAGDDFRTQAMVEKFRNAWNEMGCPTVIIACPTCMKMFSRYHKEIKVVSLWVKFLELGLPATSRKVKGMDIAIFDPCAGRYDTAGQEAIRKLLNKMEFTIHELKYNRKYAQCCGYGGLTYGANPQLTEKIIRKRAGQSQYDYVTYCTNCRDTFSYVDKGTLHILDILFGRVTNEEARRDPASLSQKRLNRIRLKNDLLVLLWGETPSKIQMSYDTSNLIYSPELVRVLDARLILLEEVKQVIEHAEKSLSRLRNTTGHFVAHLEIGIMTIWVEYTIESEKYYVWNAYCHRLRIEEI